MANHDTETECTGYYGYYFREMLFGTWCIFWCFNSILLDCLPDSSTLHRIFRSSGIHDLPDTSDTFVIPNSRKRKVQLSCSRMFETSPQSQLVLLITGPSPP